MRAAVLKAPNELVLAEAPEARAEPGDLVLRVKGATICGTDIRILRGRKTVGVRYPSIIVRGRGGRGDGRVSRRHACRRLTERFTVVAPDLRGFGYTDKPPVFEG